MPLSSTLFTKPNRDQRLEDCLTQDSRHITLGAIGDHVSKIQLALIRLTAGPGRENLKLTVDGKYGSATATAVKIYKSSPSRNILGSGQKTPDDIVGKLTIKSLDDEMRIIEEEEPPQSSLITSDPFGAPHPASFPHSRCPTHAFDAEIEEAPDKSMNHFATPINPLRFGKMLNIGGAFETNYLGFVDAVPDPKLDPGMLAAAVRNRLLTSSLQPHTVSDICFRSTPLDGFMRKEIPIICMRGARLTYVSINGALDDFTRNGLIIYFNTIGVIVQSGILIEKSGQVSTQDRKFAIVSVLNVNPVTRR
jgi:hypothetical protein